MFINVNLFSLIIEQLNTNLSWTFLEKKKKPKLQVRVLSRAESGVV